MLRDLVRPQVGALVDEAPDPSPVLLGLEQLLDQGTSEPARSRGGAGPDDVEKELEAPQLLQDAARDAGQSQAGAVGLGVAQPIDDAAACVRALGDRVEGRGAAMPAAVILEERVRGDRESRNGES